VSVKESILASGIALLSEKGIAALTQPQVARAAGIKQSHLTYYFPTRADLMLGVAEAVISSTLTRLSARMMDKPRRATLAATVADAMIAGVPPRVIIGLIVAADADPAIRRRLRKLIAHVRAQVQALLAKAGLAAGAEAALLFHAAVVGLAVMHQAQMNAKSARDARDGIAAMLRLLAHSGQGHATGGAR
jgi:AcrR family transcriptional regulator